MKKYDTYKDSGIEWIGEIPSHWETVPIKYSLSVPLTDGPHETPELVSEGVIFISAEAIKEDKIDFEKKRGNISISDHERFSKKYKPQRGDIFMVKSGATTGNLARVETDLEFNIWSPLAAFRPNPRKINSEFLFFFMKSKRFFTAVELGWNYGTQQNIGMNVLENIRMVRPPVFEQSLIATYLDRKTAEIDALIADKKRLLELYEEEKTAVINQTVTKGIDPKAKMKDSGIEWLGEIPEHWEVKKLKFIIKGFESGVSVNSLDNPIIEGEYGILKTSCVYDYSFRPEESKLILNDFELQRAKINPKKGMIIISRMNTPDLVGASGYVDQDYPNLFLPDRLWQTVFYQGIELDSKWLSYIFKSSSFRKLLSTLATGTSPSMKNLGQEDFLNIKIPFKSIEEQQSIVHHIETECARIDAKIDKTKKLIELLTEYRTALISEVVTGKVKVL